MTVEPSRDITRIMLFVLVVGMLLLGSFWTLLPFLGGLIWATTIVVATWPALVRLQQLTGRRALATAIMTLLVLLAFIAPLVVAIAALVDAASRSPAVLSDFVAHGLGPPPAWVVELPVIGGPIAEKWEPLAAGGPDALKAAVQPYGRAAAAWTIAVTGGVGGAAILIVLTVLLVAILYAHGETAARGAMAVAHRLGYLDETTFSQLIESLERISGLITGLTRHVEKTKTSANR